ncbi:MAG: DegT/DnrJ/EryC1/StrS family aminotransferase [Myxococcales bacterium]|nr:DegT/DnrJ/EryC1/StrS family aminotransferase [Myxococcales bacterium]
MIPMTRPLLDDTECDAVLRVLRSGMLVQGAEVERFEQLVAEQSGRAHGVAVANGTAALVLALTAAGVGPGDEVLVPALTWPSPAHAVRGVGATVKLVDVHPDEWNSTEDAFAAARSPRTRAAIVIDQFGNPARAAALRPVLAGLLVIEDAACALGSVFADGTPCGSLGDISCFSFHPRKVITTGEGGMCVTNDAELARRLRVLRNHGQTAPGVFERHAGNHRLTELQGALGVAQMARLGSINEGRRAHARQIQAALRESAPGLSFQVAPAGSQPNLQTLGALLPAGTSPAQRDRFIEDCRRFGAQAGPLSYALSQVSSVTPDPDATRPDGEPWVAVDLVARGVSLPLFPTMSDADREQVISAVTRAYAELHAPPR